MKKDPRKERLDNTMNQIGDNLEKSSKVLFQTSMKENKDSGLCDWLHCDVCNPNPLESKRKLKSCGCFKCKKILKKKLKNKYERK